MKRKLAASFVVTIAAFACKKQPLVDPDGDPRGPDHASVFRSGAVCHMNIPVHCPKGASCNPPAPPEVDCPADRRDAGEPDPSPARPPGKSAWLRVKPHLYAAGYGCAYNTPYFCAPPWQPHHCDHPSGDEAVTKLTCAVVEAGVAPAANDAAGRPGRKRYRIEAFVHHDGLGGCRAVNAFECDEGDCIDVMPAGTPTQCPSK